MSASFRMVRPEAVPLDWSGNILLQRPQRFTREEYEKYFNTKMIGFDRLNEYLSQPAMSLFGTVPVWVLKPEYQDAIRKSILTGRQYSGGNDRFPRWQVDFTAISANGDLWNFSELTQQNKERVLNWMFEPKNGMCRGTTVGLSDKTYHVQVSDPQQSCTSTVLNGEVTLSDGYQSERCMYSCDSFGRGVFLSNLVVSEYSDECYFEEPLPPGIEKYYNEITDMVEEACEEYIEERGEYGGASLDEAMYSAEAIAEERNAERRRNEERMARAQNIFFDAVTPRSAICL